MFKLVSMDLDETLLTTDKKMPKDFKDFVSGCRDKGIIPIVATGREYTTAKRFVGDVDIDLICNNGNLIRNSMDSKTLYVNPISHEDLKEVYNLDNDKSCNLLLHVSGNKDIDVIKHPVHIEPLVNEIIDTMQVEIDKKNLNVNK